MTDENRLRLFTALEIPDEWRQALTRLEADLERVAVGQVKWVRPELMHLTLVFLGYQPAESLPAITEALGAAAAGVRPFRLSLSQPGCFGPPRGLRVVWVGLGDVPDQLIALHQAIAARLAAHAIPFDLKPLVPHVTLGRSRQTIDRAVSQRLHAALGSARVPPGLAMAASELVLMQSHLSPSGPTYRVVEAFPLGGQRD